MAPAAKRQIVGTSRLEAAEATEAPGGSFRVGEIAGKYGGGGGGGGGAGTSEVIDDPIAAILKSVDQITSRAHDVAIKQCQRAREAATKMYQDAMATIDSVEATINAKREGTSQQFAAYMEAVHASTLAADDVNASVVSGIASIRDSIDRIRQSVSTLPVAVPPIPQPQATNRVLDDLEKTLFDQSVEGRS